MAAIIAAAVVATLLTLLLAQGIVQFQPRVRWFLVVPGRLLGKCVTDSLAVVVTIWGCLLRHEQVNGQFKVVPFDIGGDDPHSAARRVLVVLGLSLAPNSYVVNLDEERGTLLIHQLVNQHGAPMPEAGSDKSSELDKSWPL